MEKFLDVIKGIDWDLLHKQKYQLIELISNNPGELEGLVNLIDSLQDVADHLRMWKFPEEYDGTEGRDRESYSE